MLRLSQNVSKLLVKGQTLKSANRCFRVTNVSRCQESTPKTHISGKVLKTLLAFVAGGGIGVVGYSWYDHEFRKQLEDEVPYAKEIFQTVFSYLPDSKDVFKTNEPPVLEPGKKAPAPELQKVEPKTEDSSVAEKPKSKKELELEKKKFDKQEAEKLLKEREEMEAKQNKDLEISLENLLTEASLVVESALKVAHSATDAVKDHTKKLREALEAPDAKDGEWDAVVGAYGERNEALLAFESLSQKAKSEIEKIRAAVADGKKNKITKKNKILYSVEEQINKLHSAFNSAVNEFSKAKSDAKVFSEYGDLVKKGKERFKKELDSILPEVKRITSSLSKLTEDELNALIAHAHKRIDQLQRQLAEQQSLEKLRLEDALSKQKDEDAALLLTSLGQEKDLWGSELNLLRAKWDVESQANFEGELKHQLTRQAAAHSDHITEVLRVQQRELEAKYAVSLSEEIEKEKRDFQKQVASWVARLHGIEEAIDKRAELEKQGHQIQKLWLACETFQTVLSTGKLGARDWQGRLKPLEPELNSIRQAAIGQPAVMAILDSVPREAIERGVWTESVLIERFKKVSKVCKQVAMIDETTSTDGSLFKYALSYVQSKFIIRGVGRVYGSSDVEVDPDELKDMFVVIENAEDCLNRGDIAQAIRFVNQLSGESRRAASDWLAEARLLLETRQIAAALLASASAAGFTSLAGTT